MSDISDVDSVPSEGDSDVFRRYGGEDHDDEFHLHVDQDHDASENSHDDETDADADDQEDGEAERSISTQGQRGQGPDVSNFVLCVKHKSGQMVPDSCKSCREGLSLFKDEEMIKKLTNNNQSGSGILARYQGRCDTAAPTLILSPDMIQLALGIFTKGVFRDSRMWLEIVRSYLSLPIEQHELLNADIKFEDALSRFRKMPRFHSIFKFGTDMAKCIKNLRISQ